MTTSQDQNSPLNFATVSSLLITGLVTFMLCSSGVFSILSPLPLIHTAFRHGKFKSYIVAALTITVALFALPSDSGRVALALMLGIYIIIALISIEVIDRGIKPIRGIVCGGIIVSFLLGAGVLSFLNSKEQTASDFLTDKITENSKNYSAMAGLLYEKSSIEYKAFIQKIEKEPESFANEIVLVIPKVLIVLVFITFWINLSLGLKTRFLSLEKREKIHELIHVKVPEQLVWFFIMGLVFVVFGDYLEGELGEIFPELGSYVLTILSVFYFFQGFGVYVSFLDNLKVIGFFRSLLIVSTVYLAFQILILIGFSDMFVNYRRFFKKNNNQGEL